MKALEVILSTAVLLSTLSATEISKADFIDSNKTPISVMTKNYYQDKKERLESILRKGFICYEEWEKAVNNPDSKEAEIVKFKARIIIESENSFFNLMTDEQKQDFHRFCKMFSLDLYSILPKDNPKKAQEIIDITLDTFIYMRMEIDKTYGRAFNYIKPSLGELIVMYNHFQHEAEYIKKHKKQPDYLNQIKK